MGETRRDFKLNESLLFFWICFKTKGKSKLDSEFPPGPFFVLILKKLI